MTKSPDPEPTDAQAGEVVPRPLRADAERNRRRVLEVAEQVFAAEGLAVPIDDIARRAGLGVGTVYRHFPTKEALISAILAQRLANSGARARAMFEAGASGHVFFEFLTEMVHGWRDKKHFMEALARAGVDLAEIVAAKAEFHAELGKLLARAQEQGVVRQGVSVEEIMALLAGAFVAIDRHAISEDGKKRMLAIVFDGLRPGAAP
ncbi:MAG: Transcriptional regulator, TetR family [Labilithrix sp.]|nr:Transcriptional regulator, TetR family [Labilithrix sp.]